MKLDERIAELETERDRIIAKTQDDRKETEEQVRNLQAEAERLASEHNSRANERFKEQLRVEGALRELRRLAEEGE